MGNIVYESIVDNIQSLFKKKKVKPVCLMTIFLFSDATPADILYLYGVEGSTKHRSLKVPSKDSEYSNIGEIIHHNNKSMGKLYDSLKKWLAGGDIGEVITSINKAQKNHWYISYEFEFETAEYFRNRYKQLA